jgi:putative thiazole-containing bacteriocin maturation protein
MKNFNPSMRLKVKRDTFFLPDTNNSVYFRNNVSSFRMEGSMIDRWVEKLLPMFNGGNTLEELTNELPRPYRNRVYEIAEVLYKNGFVRDVSQDHPHQLPDSILQKYASQIEFLDSFGDSGAYRFQVWRQTKLLAVGSGSFLLALVSSLLESGIPKFHFLNTERENTNNKRLLEMVSHFRKTDPEVAIEEIQVKGNGEISWREIVQQYNSVLYVSENVEELREIHAIFRDEGKVFIPAICLNHAGIAGPIVFPDSKGCFESAWRSLHQPALTKDLQQTALSTTAKAMLANLIVFELLKKITGVLELENRFFLLDLETLEGNWHSFTPHPLVTGRIAAEWIKDFDFRLKPTHNSDKQSDLLLQMSKLTSVVSGKFHIWEEGDLIQLPLAQCRVQPVDFLSEGPSELLQETICAGLTHAQARREAGLTGIESYFSQISDLYFKNLPPLEGEAEEGFEITDFTGIGAGETFAEAVCRGLEKCLDRKLSRMSAYKNRSVSQVQLSMIEDEHCRFYLQALTKMKGEPKIGIGKQVFGFPVVWVGSKDRWFASAGLNITLALRRALLQALLRAQNKTEYKRTEGLEVFSVLFDEKEIHSMIIPSCDDTDLSGLFRSAVKTLEKNKMRLRVCQLELEPFLKDSLEGVYGVMLREEEAL